MGIDNSKADHNMNKIYTLNPNLLLIVRHRLSQEISEHEEGCLWLT